MERVVEWSGPEATRLAGLSLGRVARAGDSIGLVGDLGAGKTLFVQGVAEGLAIPPDVRITSPTFTLVNEYPGGRLPLYHADLYRIERAIELDELGLDELLRRADGLVCVEWSDRFRVLSPGAAEICIEVVDERTRRATVRAGDGEARELVALWLSDS